MGTLLLPDLSFPREVEPWLARFCQNVQTSLQEMATALENSTKWQTGAVLASATTITVTSTIHCLTGSSPIYTINQDVGGVRKAEQLRGSDKPRLGHYNRKVPHQQHPGEHREDSGDSPVQSTSHGTEEGVRRDKQDGPVPTIQHPVVPRINVEKTNRRKHEVIPLEIPANKVSKWWPLIRGGIEEVLGRNSPGLIPEDVYSFLAQKRAWLVIAVNKETKKYEGFVILAEELPNVFLDVPDMLIWIAYSKVPGTALKLFPHIEKAAKKNGYKRIAFHSARDGWQKRAKAYGFSLTERVYHKRL